MPAPSHQFSSLHSNVDFKDAREDPNPYSFPQVIAVRALPTRLDTIRAGAQSVQPLRRKNAEFQPHKTELSSKDIKFIQTLQREMQNDRELDNSSGNRSSKPTPKFISKKSARESQERSIVHDLQRQDMDKVHRP